MATQKYDPRSVLDFSERSILGATKYVCPLTRHTFRANLHRMASVSRNSGAKSTGSDALVEMERVEMCEYSDWSP